MFFKGYKDYLKEFILSNLGAKEVLIVQSYEDFTIDSHEKPLELAKWVEKSTKGVCKDFTILKYENTSLIVDVSNLDFPEIDKLMLELEKALMWEENTQDCNWHEPRYYDGKYFCNRGALKLYGTKARY